MTKTIQYKANISTEAAAALDALFVELGIDPKHEGKGNRSAGMEWLGRLAAADVEWLAYVLRIRYLCENPAKVDEEK